jgi:hypothetical protein
MPFGKVRYRSLHGAFGDPDEIREYRMAHCR